MINKAIVAKVISFSIKILLLATLIFGVHYLVLLRTPLQFPLPKLIEAYLFAMLLHWVSYNLCLWVSFKNFDKIGFAFLGLTLVKMGVTLLYLWPLIQTKNPENQQLIIQFFVVYFLFIFIEAQSVFTLLNKEKTAKPKTEGNI